MVRERDIIAEPDQEEPFLVHRPAHDVGTRRIHVEIPFDRRTYDAVDDKHMGITIPELPAKEVPNGVALPLCHFTIGPGGADKQVHEARDKGEVLVGLAQGSSTGSRGALVLRHVHEMTDGSSEEGTDGSSEGKPKGRTE